MTYDEAVRYVRNTERFGVKAGLGGIRGLMARLGDPHLRLRFVHVAGTNGKGSTCSFLNSIFMEAGMTVGLYTSPYVCVFEERIRVGGKAIGKGALAGLTGAVKAAAEGMVADGLSHPTEFEIITAIGMLYYEMSACDVVVLETGLGGRLDATNVIGAPEVAVITGISEDHTSILGDTLEKIAYEKAGIIKEGGAALAYAADPGAMGVFARAASERGARLHGLGPPPESVEVTLGGTSFDYMGMRGLRTSLIGAHQALNASLALRAVQIMGGLGDPGPAEAGRRAAEAGGAVGRAAGAGGLGDGLGRGAGSGGKVGMPDRTFHEAVSGLDEGAMRKAIAKARWPGRLEVLSEEPLTIIDGAHNKESVEALASAMGALGIGAGGGPKGGRKVIGVYGSTRDVRGVIGPMLDICGHFYTIKPNGARGLGVDAESASGAIRLMGGKAEPCADVGRAVRLATERAGADGCVLAFGSLYFIGEVRDMFTGGAEPEVVAPA